MPAEFAPANASFFKKNYGATDGMTSQPADAPGVPATF
jgi:hypothetical protein